MKKIDTWATVAPNLVAVASGRLSADVVIKGGNVVNVHTREVLSTWDIAIKDGRFAYVGPNADHTIGDQTRIINAAENFVIPGLLDAHMHIESGMLTPAEFARAVIPHGTTTFFHDPHEIANVFGLRGVRLMYEEAELQPINIFTQMPSCAPSAPGLETTGFKISAQDVKEAMEWPNIIGLGEMMNFPGVINGDKQMLTEIAETQNAGKIVGGHYASSDLGARFHAYVAGGPADDHEGTREVDAIARVRQGMGSMLRLGSAWYDVESQITAITEKGLDSRQFMLCTDDCHSGTLVNDGHMNRVVRHAIECGCEPLVALQMASINTATHFGLERELGSIAPGRRADLILTSDLNLLPIDLVMARGEVIAKHGNILARCPHIEWPDDVRNSVNMGRLKQASDFEIKFNGDASEIEVKVIGVVENQAPTKALNARLSVGDNIVEGDEKRDICQIALVERHKGTENVVNGFVSGFGYRGKMAMASTVAHDSHHMIVVGTSREDMAKASNRAAEIGGGIVIFKDGVEIACVELPIAGLMSDESARDVSEKADRMVAAMRECGCELNNAYMQHSLLALVVIPELRISDLGIVDVTKLELVDLFSN